MLLFSQSFLQLLKRGCEWRVLLVCRWCRRIKPQVFTPEAISALQSYDWTGNIRELRNVVERLIILGGAEITEEDVELFGSRF